MNIECLNHEPADVEIKQVDSKNVHKKIYFLSLMDSDFISSVRSSSGYHGLIEIRSGKPLFQIFQILQIRK